MFLVFLYKKDNFFFKLVFSFVFFVDFCLEFVFGYFFDCFFFILLFLVKILFFEFFFRFFCLNFWNDGIGILVNGYLFFVLLMVSGKLFFFLFEIVFGIVCFNLLVKFDNEWVWLSVGDCLWFNLWDVWWVLCFVVKLEFGNDCCLVEDLWMGMLLGDDKLLIVCELLWGSGDCFFWKLFGDFEFIWWFFDFFDRLCFYLGNLSVLLFLFGNKWLLLYSECGVW